MDPQTVPSCYDEMAWFYHKYWGGGPTSFTSRVLPIVDRLILRHVPRGGRILDLCCGTGQLARELAARGYRVTGVDGSVEMLKFARDSAPGVEFVHADARSFPVAPHFDAALCLYDSLNHLMHLTELSSAVRNVHAALRRGGPFLCDFNMQAGFEARWRWSFGIAADDHALVYRSSYDATARVGRATVTMFRLQQDAWRRTDVTMHERCYAEEQIQDALNAAGFTELVIFDAERDLGMQGEVGRGFFLAH